MISGMAVGAESRSRLLEVGNDASGEFESKTRSAPPRADG